LYCNVILIERERWSEGKPTTSKEGRRRGEKMARGSEEDDRSDKVGSG
jgi:hypothetical protein